jgi:hypothetical protein
LIPGLKYFRFSPVDEALGMELDSIDPVEIDKVRTALQPISANGNLNPKPLCFLLL